MARRSQTVRGEGAPFERKGWNVTSRMPIGEMLVRAGHIDTWQLQSALAYQRCWGGRIGEALVRLGFLTERALLMEVAQQHGVPYVEIGDRRVAPAVVGLVPERMIRSRNVFPIAYACRPRRGLLVVATSRPDDLGVLDELSFATGKLVKPALASDADIARAIERHLGDPKSPRARPSQVASAWRSVDAVASRRVA